MFSIKQEMTYVLELGAIQGGGGLGVRAALWVAYIFS